MPKPYRIDPEVAHRRAKLGAAARYTPAVYIRQLERHRDKLTDDDKHKLAGLAISLLAQPASQDGAA